MDALLHSTTSSDSQDELSMKEKRKSGEEVKRGWHYWKCWGSGTVWTEWIFSLRLTQNMRAREWSRREREHSRVKERERRGEERRRTLREGAVCSIRALIDLFSFCYMPVSLLHSYPRPSDHSIYHIFLIILVSELKVNSSDVVEQQIWNW